MSPWLLPPNLLSVARLSMTPVIVRSIAASDIPSAFPWIVAASVSDLLDGFLARRFNWTSDLGQKLDPVADKLMLNAAFVAMAMAGYIPWWICLLILARDVLILSFSAWASFTIGLEKFRPTRIGKLSTVFQMSYAAFVVGNAMWPALGLNWVVTAFMVLTAVGTTASGIGYARIGAQMLSGYLAAFGPGRKP